MKNIDRKTVDGFGEEWHTFNQSSIPDNELKHSWDQYFDIFPFDNLPTNAEGFDMGCGSGRWAKFVANKGYLLNCIDPSNKALSVAKQNLSTYSNINFYNASVSDNVLQEASQDFGYSLGVLHHIPDTLEGIMACSKLLKKDAPFLLYLYYNFENRSLLFRLIWKLSDLARKIISLLSPKIRTSITTIIAYFVYFPLARISFVAEKFGIDVSSFPLSDYRKKTFYFMKTDALDRFGTRLEKRFSKDEIQKMLEDSGFKNIQFSDKTPFWVCIAYKG